MGDVFENSMDDEFDPSLLEDNEPIEPDESVPKSSFNFPVYCLRLEYSCENLYAKADASLQFCAGDYVIVETKYGRDSARVLGQVKNPYNVRLHDVLTIQRVCDASDIQRIEENRDLEADATQIFCEKVRQRNLAMKLVAVHFVTDENRVLFFFSAESRVDFRDLVRDLVGVFRTRIELRQIGVRDEARITGGLGICGRPFCCHCISDKAHSVSIKMAKDQNLSLNSTKISGQCGRLLCCLAYEEQFYSEARKSLPQEGTKIFYDDTDFKIIEINYLTSMIKMLGVDGRLLEVNTKRFSKEKGQWCIN